MKMTNKNSLLFTLILPIIFIGIGCEGPQGPIGPEGPEGPPGPLILPASFEFSADLTQDNQFEAFMDIPEQIEVFESDIIIAFVLEDFIEEEDLEVWRQLPLTDFTGDGTRVMNFDFTFFDVRVFLDANYQLGENDEFFDLFFRAVHVPADFVQDLNTSGIESINSPAELGELLDVEVRDLGKKETE